MSCMPMCRPITILNDRCCGVDVKSTCSTSCTKVCCTVTYTVVITNNCTNTLNNVCLHVPLDNVFCLDTSSVTVNGEAVEVTCLDNIPIGTLASGSTATVVYNVTVMDYKRYIKTKALVTFYICCCCQRRDLGVFSNCNLLQCCRCCCCCNNSNS